ncbi:anti-sigma E factor [Salinivibrio sp. MA351]|jgi:sigma-E factor negative regulatory protein RseA|uniref:Anti-sigma-E factor RseA n=1 Tax=Salinivibrio costicola subsp. alcaliphilus TaxID=272773 RepID=A0ABX3KS25_SALCS|nr:MULTISPECIES: RseA family anti-sigma factor [Salinivibrio]NUY57124.1 anti-sigma E factor [Salinivibrio sp. EAGSL]OOE94210.1 anti-sigma E factor [Salinivibrio sp. AR647]OOF01318.1 anti-sigma E factor [Salinivibrio sp. MA351]OOF05436.1 anti-sigma E factor [Salinivibrio sp. MA607]OOF19822.1 anti-sigma E factor [Salinivibrio sp. MA427]
MTDKEKISALLDGERVDTSVIHDIERDNSAQQTWSDFGIIRDVMRGDAPGSLQWNIADSVASALEAEPAYQGAHVDSNVHPMHESQPRPEKARRHLPGWLQQLTQVSVAACVSLAVIVGVQHYNQSEPTSPGVGNQTQPPVLETIPFAGAAEPVSLSRNDLRATPSESEMMEQRRRVNAMLKDYELQLRLNKDSLSSNQTMAPSTSSSKQ